MSNSQYQLHLIRPKWNVALEDYGKMGNTAAFEVDGKKINLQNSDGKMTDEIDSPDSGFAKNKNKKQRLSWMHHINNNTLNLEQ